MYQVSHKAGLEDIDPAVLKALAGALAGGSLGYFLGGKKKLLPTLAGAGAGAGAGYFSQMVGEREQAVAANKGLKPLIGTGVTIGAYFGLPKLLETVRTMRMNRAIRASQGGVSVRGPLAVLGVHPEGIINEVADLAQGKGMADMYARAAVNDPLWGKKEYVKPLNEGQASKLETLEKLRFQGKIPSTNRRRVSG